MLRLVTALACSVLMLAGQARDLRIDKVSRGTPVGQKTHSWPSASKRWALIIGVNQYDDGQITPLQAAANDATALADAFTRYAGFPKEQVILLASNQPQERHPTKGNILVRLANLARLVPKDGLLLFAFAGHGIERNSQAFLLPSDAKVSDNVRVLQSTALSVTELKDWIQEMGVKQVLMLLDACRNDPTAGRGDGGNPMTQGFQKQFDFDTRNGSVEAFATLYATRVGQRAYEYSEKKQGYFTWAVVEALKGRAANDRGEITLAALEKFIQEAVPRQIAFDLGSSKDQRPFADVRGYKAGELVIAAVTPGAFPASQATSPPAMKDPKLIELEAWESVRDTRDIRELQSYQQRFAGGAFAEEAARRIERLEWEAVKDSKTAPPFRAYLAKYPSGVYASVALVAAEKIERQAAGSSEIEDVLRSYEKAYQNRNVEQIKALWPTLAKRDISRIESFFQIARQLHLKLNPIAPAKIEGNAAVVVCRRVLEFTDDRGSRRPTEDTVTIQLRNPGSGWAIDSIR